MLFRSVRGRGLLGNLGFKDAVISSNLLKFRIYLLKLLLILFINGYLLVNKLFSKSFKVRFRLVRIEGLLFHRKSRWVLGFGVGLNWGFNWEDGFDHENPGWFLH